VPWWRLPGDSVLWLVGVAVLFVLVEITLDPLRMPLGTDEITYIAQSSAHASPVMLPPVHGRGVALLAAPVSLLTTSLVALRVWMALLSGLGLFLSLLAWRGLRKAWVLAVAGALLGMMGIAQLSGVQVMPDWWEALAILAVTGLFMQAVTGRMRPRLVYPLLALGAFFLILLRLQNVVLLAPVVAAGFVMPAWWNKRALIAIFAGIAAGGAEWVAESFLWYGDVSSRLTMMGQEPPRLGLYFALPYQLRVLNGPVYCMPGVCTQWSYPWLTIWWAAFIGMVILGIFAARRMALVSSSVAVAGAVTLLVFYTLFLPIAAPRYMLPVIALLAIPAADGVAWLAAVPRWRKAAVFLIAVFLLSGAISQHFVHRYEAGVLQDAIRESYTVKAAYLRRSGIHPPCVVTSVPVAYYVGCAAPWTGQSTRHLLAQNGGRAAWHRVILPGMHFRIYVRK
jgi:hypothetical protein